MLVCPRARSPNAADAKIRQPPMRSTVRRRMSTLSTRNAFFTGLFRRKDGDENACERERYRKHPVAHYDLVSGPTDGLEMMVQGRNAQKLAMEYPFPEYLQHVGE